MRRRSTDMPKWFWILFVFIGTGLLTGAAYAWYVQWKFMEDAVTAEGRVVELQRHKGSARPVVVFTDPSEKEHRITGSVWSKPPSYSVGETVKVAFPRGKPAEARLLGFFDRYLVVVVLGGIGGVFTLLGTLFRAAFKRRGGAGRLA